VAGQPDLSLRREFLTRLHPERAKNRALHQLEAMGYQVTLDRVG
jgi:hypothetical protein